MLFKHGELGGGGGVEGREPLKINCEIFFFKQGKLNFRTRKINNSACNSNLGFEVCHSQP